jgi:acyl-CoA thioester hydrolase
MKTLWRGNANAWECDELGHLNVKFYLAKAMEAVAHLGHEIGLGAIFQDGATATLIVREAHINFIAEARPGAPLEIRGGITSIGSDQLAADLVMQHGDESPAAGITLILEHCVPQSAQAFNWPARVLAKAKSMMIEPAPACLPRGLPAEAGSDDVSLHRADELALTEIGRGLFSPQDCDAFGYMRAEYLLGKVSDSVIHLREAFPEEWDAHSTDSVELGGALLECRIRVKRRPQAGDIFVVRSGLVDAGNNVRRLVHWALDPVTGKPWWTMEGVAAMLDLKARRIRKIDGEALKKLRRGIRQGLSG